VKGSGCTVQDFGSVNPSPFYTKACQTLYGFFVGGVRFSSVCPTVFVRFLRVQIFPLEDCDLAKKSGEPMRDP
jgi:hypothetical protein